MLGIGGWEITEGGSNCSSHDAFTVENGVSGSAFERPPPRNAPSPADHRDNNTSSGGYSWPSAASCHGNIMTAPPNRLVAPQRVKAEASSLDLNNHGSNGNGNATPFQGNKGGLDLNAFGWEQR